MTRMSETRENSTEAKVATNPSGAPPRSWHRSYLLPLGLAFVALVILNAGLYLRLAAPAQPPGADSAAAAPAAAPSLDTAGSAAPSPQEGATQEAGSAPAAVIDGASLLLSDTFSGGEGDSPWHAFSGQWVIENNTMVQKQPEGFDHGTVRDGVFLNYSYAVTVQQLEGVGAGVIFNLPAVGTKNGGHLVRFTDDGSGVFWGSFDEQGELTGQGYAATAAPGTTPHRLEILSGPTTYAIKLDGALIAQSIPLVSKSGHIGLIASQTVATYSDVQIYGLTGDPAALSAPAVITETAVTTPTDAADGLIGGNGVAFAVISGDWTQQGTVISQNYMTATDFLAGTGVMAERYLLNATILMTFTPTLTDAGAGIVFHMPERDNKAGAQMVRFVEAGKGLSWGHFDEAGAFVGEGYSSLNLPPDEPHKLTLAARGDTFDILVNDEPIVQNLRAQNTGGFIGLTSFRGPNQFSDVALQLGSVVP